LEYGSSPFDDQYILGKMNEAYKFMYNHMTKAQDDFFGIVYPLAVVGGTTAYTLPSRVMWQKRISAILVPSPTQLNTDPWRYVKVPRVAYKQSGVYQTSKVRSYVPACWSMLGEQLFLFPVPVVGYTAKVILTPRLIPLGVYSGKIVDFDQVNGTITLDDLNDTELAANATDKTKAFLTVVDRNTGVLLSLLPYNAVDTATKKVTLAPVPKNRTMFEGVEIADYTAIIGTASSVTIQDLKYQSKVVGTLGDNVRLVYTAGSGVDEVITVTGKGTATSPWTITVAMITIVGSTATQIKTAIEADATASDLVLITVTGTGSTVQVVTSATSCAGGVNATFGIDDIVSYSLTNGASIFGDAFDNLIVDWTVQKIRGVLNESDPETVATLKLKLQELHSDTCGRDLGVSIERVSYVRPTYAVYRRG
jgi:hypothetical protein